ncbi:MAG: hypothetical protein U5N56_07410 [Candidatus Marinimicrobia bacterium]|nr:hypothetical protein [Candidatus Neomarinimicrobiota bacterium]
MNRFATYLGDKTHELNIRDNELQISLGKRRQRLTDNCKSERRRTTNCSGKGKDEP